jgi:hypothetical protein
MKSFWFEIQYPDSNIPMFFYDKSFALDFVAFARILEDIEIFGGNLGETSE